MTKQIGQVLEKDYARLGRGERESTGNGIHVKKRSDQKTMHVSVLEKRETNQNKATIEMGLRVWSKKARKKESAANAANANNEGITLQMVNRGKIQRDRGVTMESLDMHQFKEKKGNTTGVYTRVGVVADNPMKLVNGRKNVYKLIQKNMVDQDRKRIGVGRKEHHIGKRMWFNTKKRNEKQIRNMLNILSVSVKNDTEINQANLSKKLKDVYRRTIMKGLMKQVFAMVRITASRNKEKTEKAN